MYLFFFLLFSLCYDFSQANANARYGLSSFQSSMPCLSQPTNLRKRGSIDLNRTPSPEAEENVMQFGSSNAMVSSSAISDSTNRNGNQSVKNRKKPVQITEERKRKNAQHSSNSRIRKQKMVKEALEDPSKMTPELQRWIANYKERNRRNSAKTYARFRVKVKNNLPLTERDHKRLQAQRKTKEWRDRDPKNQARYERHLEYNRRKRKEQKEAKATDNQQKGFQKRAVQFDSSSFEITLLRKRGDLDLNLPPPPEDENSNDQSMNDKERSPDIPGLTNDDASQKKPKLRRSKKVKMTPEERRKRRTESTLNSRRRKREMFKKALEDPSIMTPELLRWSEKYKAANRRSSAKQYAKVKAQYENNLPLTESARHWFERTRYTKEWRNRHPDNQVQYEKHLKKRRDKTRQKREAKLTVNQEHNPLQKRAFDLNRSPEPESDQSPTHSNQAGRLSSIEDTQSQKKPFNEIEGPRRNEAQSSQITPEIQKFLDRAEAKRLASKRSYAEMMKKKREGEVLTPQQQKRYERLYRTKEWRKSETNEAIYKQMLQRRKDKKSGKVSIDSTRQSKTSYDNHDLSKNQRKVEEEKKAKKERNNRSYRQRMDRFKEARKDPSKMTPELQEEIENYYRKNNESTKRYQNRIKAEKAKSKKV